MNFSPLQLFNLSTLAAASATFAAAMASAAPNQPVESTSYWFRVTAPEAVGARLESTLIPSRKSEIELAQSQFGDDGVSGWVRMPRILANGGGSELYSGLVLRLMRGKDFVTNAMVRLDVAAAPDGGILQSLPPRDVRGGVITAVFDASAPRRPPRAFWFTDHLDALEKVLDDAGYRELFPADFGGMILNYNLRVSRFKSTSALTRDERVMEQLARIGRKLGGNAPEGLSRRWLAEGSLVESSNFVTAGGATGTYTPRDADWPEKCRRSWEESRKRMPSGAPAPDIVKVGDEVGLVRSYVNSPAFRVLFEAERRRLAPELPEGLPVESVSEAGMGVRPETREARLVRYLTVRALNKETALVYRDFSDEARRVLGNHVRTKVNEVALYYGGGFSAKQTWGVTPDPLLLAREGALDLPEIQGLTPYYPPTGPFADMLLSPMFVAQMRELNTRPGGRSMLMLFPCRCEEASYAHAMMTALLNANTDLSLWTYGFRASGWEWADVPEKWREIARCTHWLPTVAPYLVGQKRQKADVAILATEATDIWRTNHLDASKSEMRGLVYALRFSGYRIDFMREHMVEDGFLDGYKVLFATMPHANRVVQGRILDWVKAGGTLVLAPGALTRDEADDASSLFDEWRVDVASAEVAPVSEFEYKKTDTSAPARETAVGKGRIVAVPHMAGMNFCSGAARRKGEYRDETIVQNGLDELNGTVRYGVPYWLEGDEGVREKIAALAEAAGATRQIMLSHGNIDAGVLDNGRRAFVGFANYNPRPVKGLVAEFALSKRYDSVKALGGAPVKVEWDGPTARCTFDLDDAQALLFE